MCVARPHGLCARVNVEPNPRGRATHTHITDLTLLSPRSKARKLAAGLMTELDIDR